MKIKWNTKRQAKPPLPDPHHRAELDPTRQQCRLQSKTFSLIRGPCHPCHLTRSSRKVKALWRPSTSFQSLSTPDGPHEETVPSHRPTSVFSPEAAASFSNLFSFSRSSLLDRFQNPNPDPTRPTTLTQCSFLGWSDPI